jgi:hypothetical protein
MYPLYYLLAHWDNVAICQLLIHYGANTEVVILKLTSATKYNFFLGG